MSMNVFTVSGRLTRDAEQTTVGAKGTLLTKFTVANNIGFGANAVCNFINVQLWGNLGASLFPYLKQGKQVIVSGSFSNKKWTDQDGHQRDNWVLDCREVELLADAKNSPSAPAPSSCNDSVIPF